MDTLSDGGTDHIFTIGGLVSHYRAPPPGFDPSNAPTDELALYGIPPRPTQAVDLAAWNARYTNLKFVQPPTSIVINPSWPSAATSTNWSGYVDTRNTPGDYYNWANIQYNEPQALSTPCSGNAMSTWTGLGGFDVKDLEQDGTELNVSGMSQHQGWTEVYPAQNMVPYPGVVAHAGYRFLATTSEGSGGFSFTLHSYYDGSYGSLFVESAENGNDTADFIGERPSVNNIPVPLTNFSYLNVLSASANSVGEGVTEPFGSFNNAAVTMNDGHNLAHPGSSFNSGQSFNDYYDNCT